MNQEMKKTLSVDIKKVLSKFGMKGSISIRHYSFIVVKIKSGKIQFEGSQTLSFLRDQKGIEREFLSELLAAMNGKDELKNHDDSDCYTDYHDVGWYVEVQIGDIEKPYIFEGSEKAA